MSQQNKTTLQAAINSQIADNTTGDISAADVRGNLINMTDSLLFNSGSQGITGSLTVTNNITASGDIRLTTAGNAVIRPVIALVPNGTASYNPNSTNTTAYANYGINLITTASSQSYCFRLPETPTTGKTVTVINNSGINVVVFPSVVGGEINGLINGYAILPSDGKSYSFDCYENPLPGGWSLGTPTTPGNISISTGEINWNLSSSLSRVIGYVNDSIKGTGGGTSAGAPSNGLYLSQYVAGTNSWSWGGNNYAYAYSQILPDTIPGTGVWESIDSMQIQTNITGGLASSFYATFGMGYVSEIYYNPSNPNYSPNNTMPWTPPSFFTSPSYVSFNTNVRTPWFAARPGTVGQFNGSAAGINAGQTTITVVPGTFTPSNASQYTSNNIGDPGTLIFNLSNFAAYLNNIGLRMIGRNYIGSFVHPTHGLLDSWYTANFSPFFGAYPGAPFIPNIKFNTVFNVQI